MVLADFRKSLWGSGLAMIVMVAGCANRPDPYAYEKEAQAQQSTQPDRMTRAVLGLPAADRREPLTGPMGRVSSPRQQDQYMQRQEQAFNDALAQSGVSVERKEGGIHLTMPGEITFATGSSQLDQRFLTVLDAVAAVLQRYDQTLLTIQGHTDSRGRKAYNQNLSERRAEAVAEHLLNAGIDAGRIHSEGLGSSRPVASNATEEGRERNRRVELNIRVDQS